MAEHSVHATILALGRQKQVMGSLRPPWTTKRVQGLSQTQSKTLSQKGTNETSKQTTHTQSLAGSETHASQLHEGVSDLSPVQHQHQSVCYHISRCLIYCWGTSNARCYFQMLLHGNSGACKLTFPHREGERLDCRQNKSITVEHHSMFTWELPQSNREWERQKITIWIGPCQEFGSYMLSALGDTGLLD